MKLLSAFLLASSLFLTGFCAPREKPVKYFGMVQEVPEHIAKLMTGASNKPECPVSLSDLRYVSVMHWDYDYQVRIGHLVVHETIADEIVEIFEELFQHKFPIERMELIDIYGADDEHSMSKNNTSAYCCRENTTTKGVYSNHSYGVAIDINPLVNPYVKDDRVLPKEGRAYLDRTKEYQGGITASPNNACYRAFTSRGYEWGGSWPDRQDYQHFSKPIPN